MSAHACQQLRSAWRWACGLDVAVRKPGNVSAGSDGHGMAAGQFLDSAEAAADGVCSDGPVGVGIERAVVATRAAVGCNTNLGIVLLCTPLARAWRAAGGKPPGLAEAVAGVMRGLSVADARCAFRAIALASPGGLGRVPEQDVCAPPAVDLRQAMVLAAGRDSIARQYRDDFADILSVALPELAAPPARPITLADAVQRLFTSLLAHWPDSHIVRKLGAGVAQSVTEEARAWQARFGDDPWAGRGEAFRSWDNSLKARGINPGTSADMTVATLFVAALMEPRCAEIGPHGSWHGFCMSSPRIGSQPAFARPDPEGNLSG